MAAKNLTHIYVIMRDKSRQQKNLTAWDESSDRDYLMQEKSNSIYGHLPEWSNIAEEVRYNTSTLETKTKKLQTLQLNLVRCPSFEDNNPEEMELTTLTNEIAKLLERCRSQVLRLDHVDASGREKTLKKNVAKALMFKLQTINSSYQSSCASYSQSVQSSKRTGHSAVSTIIPGDEEDDPHYDRNSVSEDQLLFLASNQSALIQDREKAVHGILRSTLHLNQLFRDVAHLVHEQGTLVDRIDCNIETASIRVQQGREQLSKASRHQKANKNIYCILVLAVLIIILILILIATKT